MNILQRKVTENKVKYRNNKTRKIAAVTIGVLVVMSGLGLQLYIANKDKSLVEVVSVKETVHEERLITKDMIGSKKIAKYDLDRDMILYDDVDSIVGKYSLIDIRENTEIYKDMIGEEPPVRSKYLYDLKEGEEVITIPYESKEAGGKVLLPGDNIRIRVNYEKSGGGEQSNEILFEKVKVTDIINQNGESVYDITADLRRLSDEEREKVLASEKFNGLITPKAIMVAVNKNDANKYVEFKTRKVPSMVISILTREESMKLIENNDDNKLLDLVPKDSAVIN